MFSPAIRNLAYLATMGGSILHYGWGYFMPHKMFPNWLHTPRDLSRDWNRGLFWHKYTLLRHGKYPSENLPQTSGTDSENTNKLIEFCHSNRYSFNGFINAREFRKVKELCRLPRQETLLRKYTELWNWEHRNNARIVAIASSGEHTGFYLSFLVGNFYWNTRIVGRYSQRKLDVLMDVFRKNKTTWTSIPNRYLNDPNNRRRIIPLGWNITTSSWNYINLKQEKDFLSKFSGTLLE